METNIEPRPKFVPKKKVYPLLSNEFFSKSRIHSNNELDMGCQNTLETHPHFFPRQSTKQNCKNKEGIQKKKKYPRI